MKREFKALKRKREFIFKEPNASLLECFNNPGAKEVELINKEFTSLCPITGQPDYSNITITYWPKNKCVESKSLKLYLGGYRNYGAFTEDLSVKIANDLHKALNCLVKVVVSSASRGGISITSTAVENIPSVRI